MPVAAPRRSRPKSAKSSSTKTSKKTRSKSAATAKAPSKMVYYFGESKCEGKGIERELLGGKGANLADMVSIGLPVPPGFTITTDTCAAYYAAGGRFPKGLLDEVRKNIRILEKELGKTFGSAENPLLVSRPLGRRGLDAGHDGHRPQPRAHRQGRGAARRDERQRAVRLRRVSPPHQHVRRRRDGRRPREVRARLRRRSRPPRREGGHRGSRGGPQGARRGVQAGLPRGHRRGVPAGPDEAARTLDRGGLQELERRACDRVPPHPGDPRPQRHRGERAVDGLRQHGRRLRHRRRLHPRQPPPARTSSTASSS